MEVGARDPRIPPPGTLLVRHVGGRTVTVKVLERGFEYEGRIYSSLSRIAREVTATNGTGCSFSGLSVAENVGRSPRNDEQLIAPSAPAAMSG